jgi:protein TonB
MEFAQEMTTLEPRVITAAKSQAAAAAFAEVMGSLPQRVITSERSETAADEIAVVLAGMPPAPPPPPNIKVAALMAAETSPALSVSDKIEITDLKVTAPMAATLAAPPGIKIAAVVSPPPPLPRRKPELPAEPKLAAAPVPIPAPAPVAMPPQKKPVVAQEAPKQVAAQETAPSAPASAGPWKPMALAPADKPALAKPPTARPSVGNYAGSVWSRLARHKPRAGQRGSASVAFTIGEMGALRAARIARSSGNARIDQLALATVRNAAPFPAPPSGAVSYTIRIDFQ